MENRKDFAVNDEQVKSEAGGSLCSQREKQMDIGMWGDTRSYHLPRPAQVQDTFVKIKKEDAPPQARSGAPNGWLRGHPGIAADCNGTTVIEKDEQTGNARHIRQIAATSTANTGRFSLGAQACIGAGAPLKRKQSISNEDGDPSKVAKLSHEISAFGDIRESLHRQYGESLERNMLEVAEKRKIEGEEWERKEAEKKARRKLKARRLQRRKDAKRTAMNENIVGNEGQKSASYDEVDTPMSGHRLSGMKRFTKISLEERQEINRAKWGEEFSWLLEDVPGLGDSESTNDTGTQKFKHHQYDASRRTSSMIQQKTPSELSSSEDDSSEEGDTSQLLLHPNPSPF